MTDNPLIEAVAVRMHGMVDDRQWHDPRVDMLTRGEWSGHATAALRAIEDAGWKVVKVSDV
ncbi:hypothetical protein [Sphingomonas zeae]|uniref:Uncharacterized protein n=1 Tax=Sphingomonas zeae TaxID=1646122 RepID=A0A7Y6EEA8_9SPHN|nr:hypothetical protein [Sphingomonas zeae]MBB4049642.1 ribosomal protein S11 [Sphingomonas zeae]NUU46024.1 hypothetical protein [Sphingomonas zeae]